MDLSIYTTDKYTCRKCGKNAMYPNEHRNQIMGYICAHCNAVNYPVLDSLKAESQDMEAIEK